MNEKAVAVCQDVLKHLDALKLRQGNYLRGDSAELDIQQPLQQQVDQVQAACTVCALGACMLSKIRLFNEGSFDDLRYDEGFYADGNAIIQALEDIFDPVTMGYIESAFEVCDMTHWAQKQEEDFALEECRGAIWLGARYPRDADRIRAIMEAVITANGEWRPEPKTSAEVYAMCDWFKNARDEISKVTV